MTVRRSFHLLILAAILGGRCFAAESGAEFFEKRIRPVLADNCYECHSAQAKKIKGKLRLDSREFFVAARESLPETELTAAMTGEVRADNRPVFATDRA